MDGEDPGIGTGPVLSDFLYQSALVRSDSRLVACVPDEPIGNSWEGRLHLYVCSGHGRWLLRSLLLSRQERCEVSADCQSLEDGGRCRELAGALVRSH